MYKKEKGELRLLIAHPGGPYFVNKDEGSWTIPKGEIEEGEDKQSGAIREFEEETGIKVENNNFIDLGTVKLKSGKTIHAWAFEGEWKTGLLTSNHFKMEWPPKSGKIESFPEIDKLGFFKLEEAKKKLNPIQAEFVKRLEEKINII